MSSAGKPSHLDDQGRARMVDVGEKAVTHRRAVAAGRITMGTQVRSAVLAGSVPKGDVLAVARVAGIQAGKETSRWIPLCHPLPLESLTVEFEPDGEDAISVRATATTQARTGVEMEAMTAVSAALLTLYDMCKSLDRGMEIGAIRLLEKEGGKSGKWVRQ